MADTKLYIKLDKASYDETLEQIRDLNKECYLILKLFRRSWLLRLIFGVNIKKT